MEVAEKFRDLPKDKKLLAVVMFLGIAGLIFIMLSAIIPDGKDTEMTEYSSENSTYSAESFRIDTEKRLEEFLSSIEGAGDVKVCITVATDQRYIYATEGRRNQSGNTTEEEKKYVIIGNGSEKTALVETVQPPAITGAVVACSGYESPAVQEQIYKATSAALGISTGQIYVTKLKH
ncbi:MAG: hypothetical protein NC205_03095 [Prevotella sp.]|nr:hypothetical protein [Alistipes senegalensis]MCM1357553.1 hypothetical protein [Prevotella sp.]MCM1473517.1 hypothetical protein [Muribaculaceae bacterium]